MVDGFSVDVEASVEEEVISSGFRTALKVRLRIDRRVYPIGLL